MRVTRPGRQRKIPIARREYRLYHARVTSPDKQSLNYRDAGVNIDLANELVSRIGPIAKSTRRPGVLSSIGGFGGLFELPLDRYRQPVLVSGTDGVGTKLRLAIQTGIHDGIGIDLVAMCVNDVLVTGAEPLFFLDYYATGKLEIDVAEAVIAGIARGCRYAGAALIGGETAEMPGLYEGGDYDLAGFSVGIVEKSKIIDGSKVGPGDSIIGIAASGPHSNGYSLIRRILEHADADLGQTMGTDTLGEALIKPTRIYVKSMLKLMAAVPVHGIAHITGGGLLENIPRVMPGGTLARLHADSWQAPPVFDWLQAAGNVNIEEMHRTFNCGIGMTVCVPAEAEQQALEILHANGEKAWAIGRIEKGEDSALPLVVVE